MKRLLILISLYIGLTWLGCQGTTESDEEIVQGTIIFTGNAPTELSNWYLPNSYKSYGFPHYGTPHRSADTLAVSLLENELIDLLIQIDFCIGYYSAEDYSARIYTGHGGLASGFHLTNKLGLSMIIDPQNPDIAPAYGYTDSYWIDPTSLEIGPWFFITGEGKYGKLTFKKYRNNVDLVDYRDEDDATITAIMESLIQPPLTFELEFDWKIQLSGSRDLRE
jgi:hypothetical protein